MSSNVNLPNMIVLDAIFQSLEDEDTETCYSLVTEIPDIDAIHPVLSIGIIHFAAAIPCTKFSRDLFRNLISWKVDVNASTEEGYTALDVAVSNDRVQTTKFLLKHGAQPTDRALKLAQEFNNTLCEKLIRDALDSLNNGYDTDVLVKELKNLGLNPGPITKTTKPVYLRYRDRHKLGGEPILSSINQNKRTFSPELEFILTKDFPSALVKYDNLEEKLTEHFLSKNSCQPKTCFTYLLLNSRVTNNLPKREKQLKPVEQFRTFLDAIFYVGKGTNARPYAHLHEAKVALERSLRPKNDKTRQILSLWKSGVGVVCLSAFRNTSSDEALSREAAMIAALRVENLSNEIGSAFAKDLRWSGKDRCRLGSALLYRCFRIHMSEGERPLLHPHVN